MMGGAARAGEEVIVVAVVVRRMGADAGEAAAEAGDDVNEVGGVVVPDEAGGRVEAGEEAGVNGKMLRLLLD